MGFLALGDVVAAALFQTGRFRHLDAVYVWGILAGSAIGLLASTLGRLYASTYYAMRDTRTPLRYALVRVGLTTVLGYLFALPLPRWLGIPAVWGAAGLTISAGIAGWVEMLMLRRTLNARIGRTGLPAAYVIRLWLASVSGAAMAWVIKAAWPTANPLIAATRILVPYSLVFFAIALALRIPEASRALGRFIRRP
jgi:putative peptidoglycan lipid II flippase